MSAAGYLLLLAAACGLAAAQRAHQGPTAEQRAELRRGPCQVGWTLSDERCFRLAPVAAAWPEARRLCSELRPAARLASAVSSADQLLVRALWREAVRSRPAARREEAALWVNPATPATPVAPQVRAAERTKAVLSDGYGALKGTPTLYAAPEASSDESSVIVDAGASPEDSPEQECPSLTADEASTREAGYSCGQQLLYVCELDTMDLNATEA